MATSICHSDSSTLSKRVETTLLEAVQKERKARLARKWAVGTVGLLLALLLLARLPDSSSSEKRERTTNRSSSEIRTTERTKNSLPHSAIKITVFSTSASEQKITRFQTKDVSAPPTALLDDTAAIAWCREHAVGHGFVTLNGELRFVVAEARN